MWGTRGKRIYRKSSRPFLNSLHSDSDAEPRRRRQQEMGAQHNAEEDEMFAYMDEVEQEEDESEPSYPPVQPAPGTVVVDISDNEE